MVDSPVNPGDVLAGKYRVERVLGEGGIGVVVAAYHLVLDQMVALKFLRTSTIGVPQALERFHREARAAARLKSEHVARVIDVGTLDQGMPYIVMEYLDGEDLSMVTRQRPLPIPEAVAYVLQACEAMAEAHAAGIVHRDLKPANLFRTRAPDGSPHIKVLDFGIAKVAPHTTGVNAGVPVPAGLTHTSALMGSPLYMSPEQLESARDVDSRADVWALGAILFELITGRPPFLEDTLPQLCVTILQKEPLPPSHYADHVPEALDAVLLKCLSKRRDGRYSSVSELASALEPFAPAHALDSIRRILSTSRPGSSTNPNALALARSTEDEAVAPTARGPSFSDGLAPTLPMDLANTGPTEPRAWATPGGSPGGSTDPAYRPPTASRAPLVIGALLLFLIGAVVVTVVFVGRKRGAEPVAGSASAETVATTAPTVTESVGLPAERTTVAPIEPPVDSVVVPESSAPRVVPKKGQNPKVPKTGTGVISSDRE
jgi:eukaryotic-like serine/threonine-protein kinase